jgi:hypothetical protein
MSFLGGLIGGITGFLTGGPIGAVAGAVGGAAAGSAGGAVTAGVAGVTPYRSLPQAGGTSSAALPSVGGGTIGLTPQMYSGFMGTRRGFAEQPAPSGAPTVAVTQPDGSTSLCTLKGHHLNKSHYFRKPHGLAENIGTWGGAVEVPKGTACVKNRRMNVTNPRALRRALSRARGFEKLAMRTIRILHPQKHGRFGGFKTRRRSR